MLFAACGLSAASSASSAAEQAGEVELSDLGKFDLETLLDIEVTSVSKKEERLSQTAAAIYVITQEDIRRSGFTTLPEIFRMVPGMQVARVNANQWAISSRGFNDTYSNKLLVMVDGRTVYTPSFGGVFWSDQDLMLEDLDRVEVIRGPGATLWGANAVNGVINIISKKARDTQGLLLSASYGTLEQPLTNLRYGGKIGENLHYRLYGRYLNHADFEGSAGNSMRDDWQMGSGGLRLDWEPTEYDLFTLQGDYRRGKVGELEQAPRLTPPYSEIVLSENNNTSANILGRWTHTFSERSDFSLQGYYDRIEHGELGSETRENTFDLDLRQRFWLGSRNEIIWGGGYRYLPGEQTVGPRLNWSDTVTHHQLANVFVQDEITVVEDRLKLTLGSKFEHNDFTGLEIQPSARLLYTPTERQSLWASAARAIRIPTRLDTTAIVDLAVIPPNAASPVPVLARILGDPNFGVEEVFSYEFGYRIRPHKTVSLDAAGFVNVVNGVRHFVPGAPYFVATPVPHAVVDAVADRHYDGLSFGAELAAQWAVTDSWRLHAGYGWIDFETDSTVAMGASTPEHQFHVRSYLDLPANVQLMGAAYYVDAIAPSDGQQNIPVDSYVRVDVGVTWRPIPSLELGIWGQNLLDQGHVEFTTYRSPQSAEVPRSVVGRITWSY